MMHGFRARPHRRAPEPEDDLVRLRERLVFALPKQPWTPRLAGCDFPRKACRHRMCPVCEGRRLGTIRKRVQALFCAAERGGLVAVLATVALKHSRETPLAAAVKSLRTATAAALSSRPFKRVGDSRGVVGIAKWMHVTWSRRNAWHPHLHVIIIIDPIQDEDTEQAIAEALRRAFEGAAARCDVELGPNGFDARPVSDWRRLLGYLARGWRQQPRESGNGLHVFDLAQRAVDGDEEAIRLVEEYGLAMQGRHTVSMSRRLRQRLGMEPD